MPQVCQHATLRIIRSGHALDGVIVRCALCGQKLESEFSSSERGLLLALTGRKEVPVQN
jgi:hypothetical protein